MSTATSTAIAERVTPAVWEVVSNDNFAIIALTAIVASLTNPRKTFDQVKLQALADDIKEKGVLQPIIVRALPGSRVGDTDRQVQYEVVAGERRYRACGLAGLKSMPVLIHVLTDDQVREIQLVENLQRDDLLELEEAEGIEQLMKHTGLSAEQVGAKIKRSRAYVYGRIKLLQLCAEGRNSFRAGTIDASRAQLLARIPDHKLQLKALEEITRKDYNGDLAWGYREAAAHVQRNYMLRLDAARFKITDATLLPDAGSCRECPKRTGAAPDIFADVDSADVCTDPSCFHAKEEANSALLLAAAHARGQEVITGREAKALIPYSASPVDGYLRLDEVNDSPTSKPLRKLIGKQMEQDGVQPTLIQNPHKEGDLIAVLPAGKVAELLAAKGHQEAAERVNSRIERETAQEEAVAKAKAKNDFEQLWRDILLQRTWEKIQQDNGTSMWPELDRFQAMRYARGFNQDKAKIACKHLGLGKVAPSEGLKGHIKETNDPERVLLLLIMLTEVEYRHWLDANDANEGLFMIAAQYGISQEEAKKEAKKVTKDKISQQKKGDLPQPPLAQPVVGLGDAKGEAKPGGARKQKLSAQDAISGIAAAMQGQEQVPSAPKGAVASPVEPAGKEPSQLGGFKVGQLVRITTNDDKLRFKHAKHAGREGQITGIDIGGKELDVKLARGTRCFEPGELEAV